MEDLCNYKWQALLKIFHNIKKTDEDAIEKYEGLKQMAKNDNVMTSKQKEGITDRCDYQIRLINNPDEVPFANSERTENRSLQLDKAQSNGNP